MRSRGFGMIKRVVRALGRRLTRAGLIDRAARRVLSVDRRSDRRRARHVDHPRPARPRRTAPGGVQTFRQWTPQSRVTARGIVLASVADREAPAPAAPAAATGTTLGAAGASAAAPDAYGRVRASSVRPSSTCDITGEILVAPMTDPGWVFLMVAAGGLIVERGSILSHTAIIGRELGIPTVVGVQNATSPDRRRPAGGDRRRGRNGPPALLTCAS